MKLHTRIDVKVIDKGKSGGRAWMEGMEMEMEMNVGVDRDREGMWT